MTLIDDIDPLNNAEATGNWTTSNFDAVKLSSDQPTPIHVEWDNCMWWTLKKSTTGYTYTSTISGTPDLTNRIVVGLINYAFADIDAIPITAIGLRISSDTGFTDDYVEWDALAQILAPENVPISGHVPVMGHIDGGSETGTFTGDCESVGWTASTGSGDDGKQGGFDWFFVVSWLGAHSETFSDTFFSDLAAEYYDSGGAGLPGTESRPVPVIYRAGSFYQVNIRFQLGHGSSDSSNIVVDETGKFIFFNNLHVNHELGYNLVNPSGGNEIRLTLTSCGHLWNDQASGNEIFDGIANVDYFKIDGCSFTNGGQISLPSDTANRYVRNTKFTGCQAGTASDGEFTDNVLSGCYAMTISGDADFTGTQVLAPAVAADGSGIIWTGNYDPDGNLDGMTFTKGTNAHHAMEFGTGTPTSMTLTNITVSGFNASDGQNDSVLYIRRTTGDVTITLDGCTGTFSYKSSGANVTIVSGAVSATQTVTTVLGVVIQSARVFLKASSDAGPFPYQESVTITRVTTTATVAHTGHGMANGDKVAIEGADQQEYNSVKTISNVSTNAYDYTVSGSPTTPATGTITSTFVALEGLTDVNGEITMSRVFASDQPVRGWARKSTSSPLYKSGAITGTIDSADGYSSSVALVLDE